MSHAVMPMADYVSACDAIRDKTKSTEPITSGELVEQIGAVHTAGKLAALESAEVLKGNLFGNPVTATAVTPIEHNTGARLESKNLWDRGGLNSENPDNRSALQFFTAEEYPEICGAANLTLSARVIIPADDTAMGRKLKLMVTYADGTQVQSYGWLTYTVGEGYNGTMSATISLDTTKAVLNVGATPLDYSSNPGGGWSASASDIQLELGTTATPYTPYVSDFSGAQVTKRGKNLFDCKNLKPLYSNAGSAYTITSTDTGVKIKSSASTSFFVAVDLGPIEPYLGKMLTLSIGDSEYLGNYSSTALIAPLPDGSDRLEIYGALGGKTFVTSTVPTSYSGRRLAIRFYMGRDASGIVPPTNTEYEFKNVQVEVSEAPTPYEPYIPPITYPADAEGNLGEVPSISPTMILECPDVEGVNIVAHYLKDIDGAFEERLAELEAAVVENA